MKVQLEKSFPLPGPAEAAWALLQDVEAVAGCMPGARIIERVDDRHFKGTVAVKMGPASMNFRGEVEVRKIEPATRSLHLLGHGTDSTGTSGAAMDLRARVEPVDAASCLLVGTSEVSVSGKAATFGGRLMSGVADQVLQQFAANFAQRLPAMATVEAAAERGAQPVETQPASPPLNGLALLWAMVRDWFHHLFGARRA
ncbi:MAG: carbon monoxide dehydrogenase [Comamonadaceae bacterium]|nr:MAG: carbon monoxide dehydrogenase [Comamonadaceae bacterium]